MDLALSESLGQEFRFAKRINSNGVTDLSYEQKKFEYEFEQISKFENFKKLI